MKKTFLAILFIFFTTFSFALEIGDKAPNFKIELSDGKKVQLSDYKGKYLFLHFWATWCGPCKMIAPNVEQIAEEYADKIVVAKLDVDEVSSIAGQYNVMSIPTLLVFKDGEVVNKSIGLLSKEEILKLI